MTWITVRLWGRLAEQYGKREVRITASTLDELKEILVQQLRDDNFTIAVNEKIVNENCSLQPGDVVDVIPPVSGG